MISQRPTIYMLIGAPGSGKSTWAKKKGLPIFSSDDLREELTGDANDTKTVGHKELFRELHNRMNEALENREDIVFDAVNKDAKFRQQDTVRWTKKYKAKVVGVLFVTPKEIAAERNREREKTVPEHVFENFSNQLVDYPIDTEKEWYDAILAVDEEGNEHEIYKIDKEHALKRKEREYDEAVISPKEFSPKRRR